MDKYVTYPPRGPLPLPGTSVEFDDGCDVFDMIASAAMIVNPAFNPYRIFDMVSGALHDPAMRLMGHFFFSGRSLGMYWASRKYHSSFLFF